MRHHYTVLGFTLAIPSPSITINQSRSIVPYTDLYVLYLAANFCDQKYLNKGIIEVGKHLYLY